MPAASAASAFLRGARSRAPRRFAALLLGLLLLVLLPARPVSAHAVLIETSPSADERLAVAPSAVELVFNEQVSLGGDGVRVLDASGVRQDGGAPQVDGGVVRQPLGELAEGWYVVAYAVVSEDGHPVSGAFMFAVGEAASSSPDAAATEIAAGLTPRSGWPWARSIGNVLLLAGVGALFASAFLVPAFFPVRVLAAAALVGGAAGHAASWWGPDAGSELFGRSGLSAGLRVAAPLIAAFLVMAVRRPRWSFAVGVVALAGFGLTGHGFTHGAAWLNWLLLTTHLVLAALWLGAAPSMAWFSWRRAAAEPAVAAAQRRFSATATVALPLVAAAGGVLAWVYTGGDVSGAYGRVLVVKSALVGACALAGLFARRQIARNPRRLRRVFAFETLAVVVLAGVSAQLSAVGPDGHEDHVHLEPAELVGASAAPSCTIELGDRIVDVSFDSPSAGGNAVHLTVLGGVFGEVEVTAGHDLLEGTNVAWDVPLLSSTHASGPVQVPLAGSWDVTVRDKADRFSVASGSCTVTFLP